MNVGRKHLAPSMGADAAVQRQKFAIKVLRHDNPIFGPKTRTVEFVPKEKTKTFARMEEDLNDDGLALETRIFDASGGQSTRIKVKKHHKASGIPVVDEMDAETTTPAGTVRSRTQCGSVEVEAVK